MPERRIQAALDWAEGEGFHIVNAVFEFDWDKGEFLYTGRDPRDILYEAYIHLVPTSLLPTNEEKCRAMIDWNGYAAFCNRPKGHEPAEDHSADITAADWGEGAHQQWMDQILHGR